METPSKRLHPVIWVAAVSVTLFSVVGIGAVTGLIPVAGANKSADAAIAQAAPTATLAAQPPAATLSGSPLAIQTTEPARAAAALTDTAADAIPRQAAPARPAVTSKTVPKVRHDPAPAARAEPAAEHSHAQAAPVRDYTPPAPPVCRDCGLVESVQETQHRADAGSGLGAVAGGLLGGVLGHQVGGGRGRDVATVVGAVAGGVAGNNMERNMNRSSRWDITIRFDDGSSRTISQQTPPSWRSGDRVKLVNGMITGA